MGKSDAPQQEVTVYAMSIHFGVCTGPVDYLKRIVVDEKDAWTGRQTSAAAFHVANPELFGGIKKEGGVDGFASWFSGYDTQVIPEVLATKVGKTTATMPAYRGIASIWFYETALGASTGFPGFYWRANSPYLPGVWAEVARASTALNDEHARIYRGEQLEFPAGVFVGGAYAPSTERLVFGSDNGTGSTDNVIITSTNGTAWTSTSVTGFQTDDMTWSPSLGLFVAVSDSDGIMTSPDGVTWTPRTSDFNPQWVAWSPDLGLFVASRNLRTTALYSSDGITWTLSSASSGNSWGPIDWSPSQGMFVSEGGQHVSQYSSDGINWSANTSINGHGANDIVWVEELSLWIRVGGWQLGMARSTDGLNWTTISGLPSATSWQSIAWSPTLGRLVAIANDSASAGVATVATSTDGINWDFASWVDSGADDAIRVLWVDHLGKFLIPAGGSLWESTDGLTWTTFGVDSDFDSNPAHIIYDCLTNTDWGMGAPASAIDFAAFTAAGATLFAENFGLSMMWTRQSTIESFVSEVLDHIEATLFVNPRTGLITLKLIRFDYNPAALPVYTPDNSVVTNFSRKLWGETVNEIVVTWTNPTNEQEETVTAQDLANIEAQGGIVSDGRNYYGVRRLGLAAALAQRDLRVAATPLAKCDIEVNRTGWDLLPGDVLVLDSPEDGIEQIVMRVGPVDYGKPGDPTVKASLVEDVFALALAEYTDPPETEWVDGSEAPSSADDTLIFTLPYFVVVNEISGSILAGVEYPEVFAGVLAAEAGTDSDTFALYGEVTDAGGSTDYANIGEKTIASRATLPNALDAEVETVILSFPDRTQGRGPQVGGLMLIEGTGEDDSELCLITSFGDSPAGYTFRRGALDTIPRAWAAGTVVWFFDRPMIFADSTIRSEAETVNYKVLIRTSLGLLSKAAAPISSETLTARPHLPLRPADVQVNGDDGFAGIVDVEGVSPIPVTWARRNREIETAIVKAWDDGDVTPETGQTTTVTLTDLGGSTLFAYTGIAGTSQNVDPANFGGESEGWIVVSSVRDGLDSLQAYRIRVLVSGELFEFEDGERYEFEDENVKAFED